MRSTLYKTANQQPRLNWRLAGTLRPICSKCNVLMPPPFRSTIFNTDIKTGRHNTMYGIYHYIGTPHYIIESRSGTASVYCSKYCMKKHNALFRIH